MGVTNECGCKEVQYIDILILLIPTPLESVVFCSSIPTFCSFYMFFVLFPVLFCNEILCIIKKNLRSINNTYERLRASHGSHMKGCT